MSLAHAQYCLQDVEYNINSESDFLSNVDLSRYFSICDYISRNYAKHYFRSCKCIEKDSKISFDQANKYY